MRLRRSHSVTQKNEVFFLVDANSQRSTALFTRPRPKVASYLDFTGVSFESNASELEIPGDLRVLPGVWQP
jgi:hypothetical protein